MLSPTFWAFVRCSSSTIEGVMAISKFDIFFLPRDLLIWPLTNSICRPMWRTRLHMWTKFRDGWLQTATCIVENVTISFKHEYRRPSLTSRCDVVNDVINIENTFSGIISDDLSIPVVKLNLSKIFRNFSNGRHFDVRASLVTRSPIGSWVQRLESQSNSLHFELLIDVLA